jgi:para-nitrobenzyl esterase
VAVADEPVVTTPAGGVRGLWREAGGGGLARSAAFLGIPYAEAPVGSLRFAAPHARRSWAGVRDARRPGPTAQRAPLAPVTTIPEPSTPGDDVLNLNVFTPAPGDASAGLPVLVWIHGGGYVGGSQNSPWYDGRAFNRDGVVTVSIGYRLGIDGWLPLDGAPPNRGALDWVAALQWVRESIAGFGGDPRRVTVAGQSAGGGAVLTLLGMPSAAGLFSRAVSFSGAIGRSHDAAHAERLARRFTELTGIPATADAAGNLSDDETQAVTTGLSAGPGGQPIVNLAPIVDGEVVPRPVVDGAGSGAAARVPLLLGFTREEFNGAAAQVDPRLPVEVAAGLLTGLGLDRPSATRLVAGQADRVPEVLGQAFTDATFRRLGVAVAETRALARQGVREAAGTWVYQFEWASRAPGQPRQAFHCLDLPFWWDCLDAQQVTDATGADPPQGLADAMHEAWLRFVCGDEPGWPAYDRTRRTTRLWDEDVADVADPFGDLRAVWLAGAGSALPAG